MCVYSMLLVGLYIGVAVCVLTYTSRDGGVLNGPLLGRHS